MKYLSTPVASGQPEDPNAFWNMATTPGAALPASFGPGNDWIALDPTLTTPNVVVGVIIPGKRPMALTPGRVLPISRDTDRVLLYNAHSALGFTYNPAVLYGRIQLVAGRADELPMWLASVGPRAGPATKAGVLAVYPVNIVPDVFFPTTNLAGIRITAIPLSAGGNVMADPGDFAVTIRPGMYAMGFPLLGTSTPTRGLDGEVLGPAKLSPINYQSAQSALDYVLTSNDTVRDLQVAISAPLAYFYASVAAAGTGVGGAMLLVEGR